MSGVVMTDNISINDLITVPLDMWRSGNEVAVSISLYGLGTRQIVVMGDIEYELD